MANSFFVGCSYVGRQVAQRELQDGGRVAALVRRAESAQYLGDAGIESVTCDLDDRHGLPAIKLNGHVLYWFAPPPPDGLVDPRIAALLNSIEDSVLPSRLVLISTTGVYGDCKGAWITESQPLRPQTDRTRRRVDAEKVAGNWCRRAGVTTIILRVPGIYGPGKLPIERLQRQEPVLAPEQSPWSNRVHVGDLVRACMAAARIAVNGVPALPVVCNISDGNPSTMAEYFFAVARSEGLPKPPVLDRESADRALNSKILSYLAESKRIDNTRMREWLGVVPEFPDLNRGLEFCRAPQSKPA